MQKAADNRARFKTLLNTGATLIVPGAFDAISARLIQQAGFPAAYVGSYATAASRFGMPDVGAVSLDEMVAQTKTIADAVEIPVLADAEQGWHNAANIWRTVKAFEDAGACGIHIEDHEFGKHTSLPTRLSSLDQMLRKISAALEARTDPNFLIIARTDAAWALKDQDEAVRRANAFLESGADMVMAGGLSLRRLTANRGIINGKIMVVDRPGRSIAAEKAAGVNVVLYYALTVHVAYHSVREALNVFARTGSADEIPDFRATEKEFETFVDYKSFENRAQKFGLG
jgi:2-methylisocitrate lyase-like PEP mutase family enzyme